MKSKLVKSLNFLSVMLLLVIGATSLHVVAADSVSHTDRVAEVKALSPADRPSAVSVTLNEMVDLILENINGRSFSAHQFLGYSGASFFDMERYKQELRSRVLQLNTSTMKLMGPDAVTVLVLGATVDGFGIAYDLIDQMKKNGEVKNVLVVGMSSNVAATYHVESLKKGRGHVISPLQEIVLLKETYIDAKGSRSWELKTSPSDESDTPKILKNLSHNKNAGLMTFSVYGGGVQAFNETLEMILESRNRPSLVQISLYVDYMPGNAKKDTGYRAADMLAYVLAQNPFLLNDKIDVRIISGTGDVYRALDFKRSSTFLKIEKDIAVAKKRIEELKTEKTPSVETEALIRYYEVLSELNKLPLLEIQNFRQRSTAELTSVRGNLRGKYGQEYDQLGRILDVCLFCEADGGRLQDLYLRSNGLVNCSNFFR